jgi:ADP-heptose:LPS heptosyltransferase
MLCTSTRCAQRLHAMRADVADVAAGQAPCFLLVRLDGLGDALACVPLLEGLRRAYPSAVFGAVCSPANATVFSARVAFVHVLGDDGETREAAAIAAQRYTHALVATEEVAGYEIARASGAQRRVGFWHAFEKPLKSLWQFSQLTDRVYRPARWTSRPEHEVQTLYRLALPFGASPRPPAEATALREWLAVDRSSGMPENTMGFQITRKLTSDEWGPSSIAAACAAAWSITGLSNAALLAAGEDEGLARSVLEHLPPQMRERTRLVPPGGVAQWFGSIAQASVLVTPDTGAAHAAGMLGVPVIDLFDQARFEQLSRQWRPWAAPYYCLVKPAARAQDPSEFGREIGSAAKTLLMHPTPA